jgi:Phage integrase central domain
VRRLPSGRWQVRYWTNDGRQHTAPETFATKTAATRHLAQVESDLSRGQWSDPRLSRTTFTAWAARWEASTVNLRANTQAAYRNLLRRYLLPTFGPMRLIDLDAMAVRAWLAKLEREGVGASTRAKAYRLLSRILATAVESGYLARNPCTIRGAAAEPAPEMRFATVNQVAALADAIPSGSGRWSWSPPTPGCAGGSWAGCGSSGWTYCTARSPWPSSSWRSGAGWLSGRPRPAPACGR